MSEEYVLTPKGLIGTDAWKAIQEYCQRFGLNGIVVNEKGGRFVKIEASK